MPRYRKKSDIQLLVERFALVPPFVTAPLALISFVVFDQFIRIEVAPPPVTSIQDTTAHLQSTLFWTVAKGWSYALRMVAPAVFVFSIVLWFKGQWHKRRDEQRFAQVAASSVHTSLHEMTWQDFERLVGRAFQKLGFDVHHTGRAGADGGIDLVLRRGSETALVQCKHWKASKVSVETVRELFGLMAERGAAHGYLVSAGTYTRDALSFASGKNLTLVTGEQLHQLIATGRLAEVSRDSGVSRTCASVDEGRCPDCGGEMVERTARRGRRVGQTFLGCQRYPQCNGTRVGAP
ncbi:restriction endonuclease [Asticcacaulis sp. W401b]|uniref:restriction endonuclease n=1 Tax=Asticcacaulis sp. W401b TaxID=3388666 RepID=UPI003970DEAF